MLGFLITNNISYIITSRTVHKEPNGKNASWSVDGAQINIARHNDALSLERTLIVADYNLAEEGRERERDGFARFWCPIRCCLTRRTAGSLAVVLGSVRFPHGGNHLED